MGWVATCPDLARVVSTGYPKGLADIGTGDREMLVFLMNGIFSEWENSYYQYEQGLFTPEEFEARLETLNTNGLR